MKSEIYNVGLSEANLSKRELCETIKQHIPSFMYIEQKLGKDPDQKKLHSFQQKIESTGFKPDNSLDDGIEELIKGYKMIKNSKYGNV